MPHSQHGAHYYALDEAAAAKGRVKLPLLRVAAAQLPALPPNLTVAARIVDKRHGLLQVEKVEGGAE